MVRRGGRDGALRGPTPAPVVERNGTVPLGTRTGWAGLTRFERERTSGGIMSRTIIVGDGPGGLSAALFLAKAGENVTVFGRDETAMHYAHLHNYLGAPDVPGSDLQRTGRAQVADVGGEIVDVEVTSIDRTDAGVLVHLADGSTQEAGYLVLSEGRKATLARSLGLAEAEGAIVTDREGRSSDDQIYVVGRSARPERSQAIISAGAGAVAAVDIISRERGSNFQDWDKAG